MAFPRTFQITLRSSLEAQLIEAILKNVTLENYSGQPAPIETDDLLQEVENAETPDDVMAAYEKERDRQLQLIEDIRLQFVGISSQE
jgi:hypothetical protein